MMNYETPKIRLRSLVVAILPALLIILAGVLAYWNSFDGVFVFDDIGAIQENVHIRQLLPLTESMSLALWETGATVDGRPLLSLSFALNHALFGPEPWGYHLVNLFIHIAAGLLLFGMVRRTLLLPRFQERYADSGSWLALAVALIWLVHPLQTESVTYIVQRAESLMGMLFLLTMYCAIRGFTSEKGGRWYVSGVLACAVGMGVKQTMVTAPILVLFYDWVFISGSCRAAFKRRKFFYMPLCATWLIVFGIICATWKDATIDFVEISPIRYLMTQPLVILYYIKLSFWPSPLVLDYAWQLETRWERIVFPGLIILEMLALMFRALSRRQWYGFVLAWFFLILAPTSSISPLKQVIFEHRMYLSLAAVVVLAVVGAEHAAVRLTQARHRVAFLGPLALSVTVSLGYLTHERNEDYHSRLTMWRGNILNRPLSFHAHLRVGDAMRTQGRLAEALKHYQTAAQIGPEDAQTLNNLGNILLAMDDRREAVRCYEEALRLKPDYAAPHNNLGKTLELMGKREEAVAHYQEAVRINPKLAGAHLNLGNTMQASGRTKEALAYYRQAAAADPDYADAHNNVGNALQLLGKPREAIPHYLQSLQVDPFFAEAHYGWGIALGALGETAESIKHFEETLKLNPNHTAARDNLRKTREMLELEGQIRED